MSVLDSVDGPSEVGVRSVGRTIGDIISATAGDTALAGSAAVANAVAVDLLVLQRALDVIAARQRHATVICPPQVATSGLSGNDALLTGSLSLLPARTEPGSIRSRVSTPSNWTIRSWSRRWRSFGRPTTVRR